MEKLRCRDHPQQEVFLKITISRTYVGADGKSLHSGDYKRKKFNLPKTSRYIYYLCAAEMDEPDCPELTTCEDLLHKEGNVGILEALRQRRIQQED